MGDVIYIEDYIPHHPFEALCVKCFHRWIAVVPNEMILKTIKCDSCGPGYVIDTGQYIMSLTYSDEEPEPGDAA